MDHEDEERNGEELGDFEDAPEDQSPVRELPADLPRSLDDRHIPTNIAQETEYYDAWQGTSTSDLFMLDLTFGRAIPFPLSSPFESTAQLQFSTTRAGRR